MITIFTISYNSAEIIMKCHKHLLDSSKFRYIVVDNASPNNSINALQKNYPEIEVIHRPKNIGYGRAANVALKMIDTPYAFLINPDLFITPEDVTKLLGYAEKHKDEVGALGPAVKKRDFLNQGLIERERIIGAAMLFNMEALKSVGFFDENIFLFYEEDDICRRLSHAGKKVYLCSDIYLKHLEGQCCKPNKAIESMKEWHLGWSRMYYLSKYNLFYGKRTPSKMLSRYFVKSHFSFSHQKRLKFRPRYRGVKAFLNGEKAFTPEGEPQMSPRPSISK